MNKHYYTVYSQPLRLLKEDHEVITPLHKDLSLQVTHPAQERLATPPGSMSPTLFKQWWRFFHVPQELDEKVLWDRTYSFRPYPRRLEGITIFRCHYKGSTFFSVIWRPWVLVQPGFEFVTNHSADQRSLNWAYQVVVIQSVVHSIKQITDMI